MNVFFPEIAENKRQREALSVWAHTSPQSLEDCVRRVLRYVSLFLPLLYVHIFFFFYSTPVRFFLSGGEGGLLYILLFWCMLFRIR